MPDVTMRPVPETNNYIGEGERLIIAPTGGRGPGPPWDLKNMILSGFLPLNYMIYIFEVCFFKLFAMWED